MIEASSVKQLQGSSFYAGLRRKLLYFEENQWQPLAPLLMQQDMILQLNDAMDPKAFSELAGRIVAG